MKARDRARRNGLHPGHFRRPGAGYHFCSACHLCHALELPESIGYFNVGRGVKHRGGLSSVPAAPATFPSLGTVSLSSSSELTPFSSCEETSSNSSAFLSFLRRRCNVFVLLQIGPLLCRLERSRTRILPRNDPQSVHCLPEIGRIGAVFHVQALAPHNLHGIVETLARGPVLVHHLGLCCGSG